MFNNLISRKNLYRFHWLTLLLALITLLGCNVAPASRMAQQTTTVNGNFLPRMNIDSTTKSNASPLPVPTTPIPVTATRQSPLTFLVGEGVEACQVGIESLLQGYETANFIYPQLSRQATKTKMLGLAAMRNSNYIKPIEVQAHLDVAARAAADYFAQHQTEGADGLRKWLAQQELLCTATAACPDVIAQNLDLDPETEYLFTLGTSNADCGEDMGVATQRVYLLDCQPDTTNCPVSRVGNEATPGTGACIRAVRDNTGDAAPEAYVHYRFCGATHCWDELEIVGSDLPGLSHRYFVPTQWVQDGCIAEKDLNDDGHKELLVLDDIYPGYSSRDVDNNGRPWNGPLPTSLEIYTWNGVIYTLADRQYTKQCLYHYIAAGIEWTVAEEYERALAVFQSVLTTPDIPESCLDPTYEAGYPWRAFAQYAVGVLSARLNEPQAAQDALARVQALDPEGVFTPLAELFLAAYPAENYAAACAAIERYVETQPEDALFYGPFPQRKLLPFCP